MKELTISQNQEILHTRIRFANLPEVVVQTVHQHHHLRVHLEKRFVSMAIVEGRLYGCRIHLLQCAHLQNLRQMHRDSVQEGLLHRNQHSEEYVFVSNPRRRSQRDVLRPNVRRESQQSGLQFAGRSGQSVRQNGRVVRLHFQTFRRAVQTDQQRNRFFQSKPR